MSLFERFERYEELQARVQATSDASALPDDVDYAQVNRLAVELVRESWGHADARG